MIEIIIGAPLVLNELLNRLNFCQVPYADGIQLQSKKMSCLVGDETAAKDSHDAVCLRGVTPIRHKYLSLYGFQNYKNNNKLKKKR